MSSPCFDVATSVGPWRAHWTFQDQFADRIRQVGFEDFRPSDVQVIARLPLGVGARITDIAEQAQISKQAMGKLVRGLEARGYLSRGPDPDDGRAQRVVLSKRGRALLTAARAVIDEIEAAWAQVLSPAEVTRLRRALLIVSDTFGPAEDL